ncbi:MAG: CoA ester lyase [Gordonia sp. (in: high G+C Gram-positive bacteria)]
MPSVNDLPSASGANASGPVDRIREAVTFLFVPGDRPERFDKAAAAGADLVVVDLEDAVSPGNKDAAREAAARWLADGNACAIRVNSPGSGLLAADLQALEGLTCTVMVPKAESAEDMGRVVASRGESPSVIALVETARGVLQAPSIAAAPGVHRLALGSFDLAAELGVDPDDALALAATRGGLVLASAAAGLPGPIDGVTASVDDADLLTADTRQARRLGFSGKLCIHPRQVGAVTAAFAPTEAERAWAQRVVEAFSASDGAALVDGKMIDKPVLDRALRIHRASQTA